MREKIKRGASNFFKIITKPEMEVLPGHLAFSFVLSIVPTLTILTYIASIFHFLIFMSSIMQYFIVLLFIFNYFYKENEPKLLIIYLIIWVHFKICNFY